MGFCFLCGWKGAINKDGTIRKHRNISTLKDCRGSKFMAAKSLDRIFKKKYER